jgi:hypothetical protein
VAEDDVASGLQGSVERVRTSARWILAAFGALGTALAIGAQFSDLGKLEGSAREWGLLGVGLAFLGFGLAIAAGGAVLVPRGQALKALAEREQRERSRTPDDPALMSRHPALRLLDERPELLAPFTSVGDLQKSRTHALSMFSGAYKAWRKEPDDAKLRQQAKAAADEVNMVEPVVTRVLSWADYAVVRSVYSRALFVGVFPGVILAAVGLTLFALNISDTPPPTPAAAEVRLENVDLRGLKLEGMVFHGADLKGADLSTAHLAHADLSAANLDEANLTGADLTQANLDGASLKGATLARITWGKTTCPDGRLSDDVGGSCQAHLVATHS